MTRLKWNRSHMLIAFIIYNNQNCCRNSKLQKVTVRYTVGPPMAIFENWQGRGRIEKPSLPFFENLQKLLYVNLWFKFLIQNAVSRISRRDYKICNMWFFFSVLLQMRCLLKCTFFYINNKKFKQSPENL